ncbi:MAG: DUF6049 family protein [Actinomycetota bacterium]
MTMHRTARGLFAIAISLVTTLVAAPSGNAQGTASATLTLVSQTPWNTLADPALELAIRADNEGATAIGDLTLGVTIGSAVRSRTVYESSLTDGPGLPIFATAIPEKGTLEPGSSRRFRTPPLDLSTVGEISTGDSLVYPLRVDLRSGATQIAAVDTALIFLVRTPEAPLLISTTIELTAPIAFGPDGRLADSSFEAAIAPKGTLGAEVAALDRMAGESFGAIDVVVEPALLDQLSRMADGYERVDGSTVANETGPAADAATLLSQLRHTVTSPSVHVTAMPFAGPTIPSLLASGLSSDLSAQLATGRDAVRQILGIEPGFAVVRPPGAALDDAAVEALTGLGASTLLVNADSVARPPQPNDFAPLPTASLDVDGRTVALVLPDPGTQALLSQPSFLADPVRAAQAMLGELATIWREQPVPSQPRGIAISLPAGLPSRFWGAFLGRLSSAPFLEPMSAAGLVARIPPPAPSSLAILATDRFSPEYVEAVKRERRDLLAFRSMLVQPSLVPDRLSRDLLYAESAAYLGNEDVGRAWIDFVNTQTHDLFSHAVPDTSQTFTFLSNSASIPLRMSDPGDLPITFTVQLRSNRFRFPDGDRQRVTITEANQIVTFTATALAAGQGTIQVILRAPTGRPIQQTTLTVRSTSVNRIAVAVTVAAALVLVALWSRRLFKRPTT